MLELGRELSQNILISIASGLAVAALTQIVLIAVRPFIDFARARRDYTLAGTWIGHCLLRSYGDEAEAVEIYYFKIRRSVVSFVFFSYRQDIPAVRKHTGVGTRRDSMVAAHYSFPQVDSRESGVFLLRARGRGDLLRGMYAQYDLGADEKLTVSGEDFELYRIRLPLAAHLRMAIGKPPMKDHAEVLALLERTGLKPRTPTVAAVGTPIP
jgi:hypothetical protein